MADYKGSQGIAALKAKINLKSKTLVGEAAEKIAINLVDESPLGAEYYSSTQGLIANDVGDYKNSWTIGLGIIDPTTRLADTEGRGAVLDAMTKSKLYNLQDTVYITNSIDHANQVEEGWKDNPEYGWKAKDGYHTVRDSIPATVAILNLVANKVSKM